MLVCSLYPRTEASANQQLSFADTDTVTLGPDLVIKNQSIGVAKTATGFNDVDGILGIGPVDLTSGMASPYSCPLVASG